MGRVLEENVNRTNIINFYVERKPSCSYLEIGVGNKSANFNKVNAVAKECVDPINPSNYLMTSDDFFKINKKKYDVIFIDGDHRCAQVIKDIAGALRCLNKGGVILLHDCNPVAEEHQTEQITVPHWNGTVWKAILFYRKTSPNISICTVDVDEGIGIIKPNQKQKLFECDENIDFKFLCKHRKEILNLLTVDEWKFAEQLAI